MEFDFGRRSGEFLVTDCDVSINGGGSTNGGEFDELWPVDVGCGTCTWGTV